MPLLLVVDDAVTKEELVETLRENLPGVSTKDIEISSSKSKTTASASKSSNELKRKSGASSVWKEGKSLCKKLKMDESRTIRRKEGMSKKRKCEERLDVNKRKKICVSKTSDMKRGRNARDPSSILRDAEVKMGKLVRIRGRHDQSGFLEIGNEDENFAGNGRTRTISAGSESDCKSYLKDQLRLKMDTSSLGEASSDNPSDNLSEVSCDSCKEARDSTPRGKKKLCTKKPNMFSKNLDLTKSSKKCFRTHSNKGEMKSIGKCVSQSELVIKTKRSLVDTKTPTPSCVTIDLTTALSSPPRKVIGSNPTVRQEIITTKIKEGKLGDGQEIKHSKSHIVNGFSTEAKQARLGNSPSTNTETDSRTGRPSVSCDQKDSRRSSSATTSDIFSRYPETDVVTKPKHQQQSTSRSPHDLDPARIPDDLYVALDCEMVGVGPKGRRSVLARCSIVDYQGRVVYDKYILPHDEITDYRTPWSGITPRHMTKATPTDVALEDIRACLKNKIVIGHAVYHDFKVLGLHPPPHTVRDTHTCKRLVQMAALEGQGNSLKKLSLALLDRPIQMGRSGHCSKEDARATLDLFKLVREEWEAELFPKWAKKGIDPLAEFSKMAEQHRVENEDFLHDRFWN